MAQYERDQPYAPSVICRNIVRALLHFARAHYGSHTEREKEEQSSIGTYVPMAIK